MNTSQISHGSFISDDDDEKTPMTHLGIHQKASVLTRPKQSLLCSERSLTIEELEKLHENLTIAMYTEPTNECKPYRPQLARPLTREQLIRRLEQARDSNMLGILKRGKSDREFIED